MPSTTTVRAKRASIAAREATRRAELTARWMGGDPTVSIWDLAAAVRRDIAAWEKCHPEVAKLWVRPAASSPRQLELELIPGDSR